MTEEMEEVMVITITSPDGEEKDFQEVDAVEIDGKIFSLLLEICENEDEAEAIIARVDEENGEPVYVDPTEEEFEAASKAFEELAAEDEE